MEKLSVHLSVGKASLATVGPSGPLAAPILALPHSDTLSRSSDDLLRHIGSPFAPDKRPTQPQALSA
jgi:hypothetical protein